MFVIARKIDMDMVCIDEYDIANIPQTVPGSIRLLRGLAFSRPYKVS